MSLTRAAEVTPPVSGQNIWGLDADDVTPAVWFAVPDAWKNSYLTFEADGEDFYIVFGDENLSTVSATAKSTYGSNAITAIGSVAFKVKDGTTKDLDMKLVDPRFKQRCAVVGASGTAANLLRILRSSGPVTKVG